MALLEKQPNNTAIDAQLRKFSIDPDRIASLPVISPTSIDPQLWPVFDSSVLQYGVIGRHKVMRYDFGAPVALCPAVVNRTPDPINRTLIAEEEIGTTTSYSISSTVEAGFFDVVKLSVTTAFGQTWSHSKKYTDRLDVTIRPGHMMWLEVQPVMRILEGDFVHFVREKFWPSTTWKTKVAARFSGTVTAPGVEGSLKDVITVRDVPVSAGLAEGFRAVAEEGSLPGASLSRETTVVPGFLATALLGDSAESEDVTDQVKPA
ncbi:hypothetical protein [Streptomyces huiliensis]|uniref:hypothetical protein n=1 Tax=Streptomyces huiliensis TaxID=2876027 RepID=UPI001CBC8DBC|nr:hypothetical protein [Streptomyces huiliensis]MBZ4320160.1 hypothetical protein [Streptomyces huiliensis]